VKRPVRSSEAAGSRWSGPWIQLARKHTRARNRPFLEALESRTLLAATITEYPALSSGANGNPTQLAVGSDGNLWFTEPTTNQVGVFSPSSKTVTSQISSSATNGNPTQITSTFGSNAALWFTLNATGQVGKIVPGSSQATIISGPGTYYSSAGITSLNGNIWFTLPAANDVGVYNPTKGITEYSLAPANINVPEFKSQITAGPDGNLWFTEPGAIGIFSPTTNSVIGQVGLPSGGVTQIPAAITLGPDGNIWFTESVPATGVSAVGVINAKSQTYITEFATATSSNPQGITAGPDGNIWFTESAAGAIGSVTVNSQTDPTQDTLNTPIPIPTKGETGGVVTNPTPLGITTGPDGNVWFADSAGALGVVTLNALPHFVVTTAPPATATAGTGFGLAVTAQFSPTIVDTAFNGSATVAISNDAGGSGTTLGGTVTVTAVNGVATFSGLTLDTAANGYTLRVSSGTASSVITGPFNVVATTPSQIAVTAALPAVAPGVQFGFGVVIEDKFGNLATTYNSNVTVSLGTNPGGSTLGGTLTVAASSGIAKFSGLTLNELGNGYTLHVAGTGVSTATTNAFNVVPVVYSTGADLGFQSPYVGVGTTAFEYDPTGSPWTFTGSAGVAGNGSPFMSGNPSAPVGTQVGFIQQSGQISQTFNLPAGVFSLSFSAAQRVNNSQTIEVLFDGTPIAFVTPSGTSYTVFTTNNFAATAGANTLVFQGLNPNGGDNSAFIDGLAVSVGNGAVDGGFESPSVGNSFQPDPGGTAWTFTGSAGVAGNNSAFTSANPPAPQGTQVGYIQQTGGMSQSINLVAGIYTVNYAAAQRAGQNQSFEVFFDGTLIAVTTPSSSSYATITTNDFIATTGANTLSFVGLNPHGGDNTAFIDNVVLSVPNTLQDGNFADPNLALNTFQYAPTGTPWTYTGSSGVAANNSLFTSGNPPAPAGIQVGFVQQTGKFSQSISLAAGTYNVNFAAAQRAGDNQTIEVLVDSQVVGIYTPAGTSYSTLTTGPFTVTGGTHTLAFVGLNPNGGDNTALIDGVDVNQPALQIVPYMQDPDFASPSVGVGTSAFRAAPAGSPWTFTGSAGVAGNDSAFTSGNPPAPAGTQVGYIQMKGQISQTISLAGGTYDLTLSAAQRGNSQASSQTFQVVVDSTVVGIFDPSGPGYTIMTTGAFTVAAGTHTLALVGLDPSGGDNSVFVDQLAVNVVAPPVQPTVKDPDFESPGVGVGSNAYQSGPAGSPWTFTGSAGLAGNGSAFTASNPSAPVGTQVAFIQDTGRISQAFTLAAGTYKLSFSAAQRANIQASSQTIGVLIDGTEIESFTPDNTSYTTQTTGSFKIATTGTHTVTFVGLNPNGGDNTAFIDQVLIASA
jgi:streptogramin lyase